MTRRIIPKRRMGKELQEKIERQAGAVRSRTEPCAYLGQPTGNQLKVTCRSSTATIAEHICQHPERARVGRNGSRRSGRCTVEGRCRDWEAGIVWCKECTLYEVAPPSSAG